MAMTVWLCGFNVSLICFAGVFSNGLKLGPWSRLRWDHPQYRYLFFGALIGLLCILGSAYSYAESLTQTYKIVLDWAASVLDVLADIAIIGTPSYLRYLIKRRSKRIATTS